MLDGGESVTVDRADGQLPSRAPTRAPAHASCGGLVLLAHASPGLVDAVLESSQFERRWDAAPGVTERVRTAIEVARRQGHLELRSKQTGTVSVAAPVIVGVGRPRRRRRDQRGPAQRALARARGAHHRAEHRAGDGRAGDRPIPIIR